MALTRSEDEQINDLSQDLQDDQYSESSSRSETIIQEHLFDETSLKEKIEAVMSKPLRTFSPFLECDCGEPMQPQRLLLDFTPVAGVDDNPHTLEKCLGLWKLLDSIPELSHLRASPVPEKWESTKTDDEYEEMAVYKEVEDYGVDTNNDKVSGVPWIKRDHLLTPAFVGNLKGQYNCEDGGAGGDYRVESPRSGAGAGKPGTSQLNVGRRLRLERTGCPKASTSSQDAKELCKQLDDWDHTQPKVSLGPTVTPKHGYCDAVLQRFPRD